MHMSWFTKVRYITKLYFVFLIRRTAGAGGWREHIINDCETRSFFLLYR